MTSISRLNQRLTELHGISLDQVLSEIGYLRDQGDSVIAGGSLAYGLGNQLSDLDLVIVGSSSIESLRVPVQLFLGSLRVDVWKLSSSLVEETFARARSALDGPEALNGAFGSLDEAVDLQLLHRVAFGTVVDGAGAVTVGTRSRREVASLLSVREYLERMRSSAFIAQLCARFERPVAAALNARQAVEEALSAEVSRRGLPFSTEKWLTEHLAENAPDLLAVQQNFRVLPDEPGESGSAYVDAAIAACGEIWNLDLGMDSLAAEMDWCSESLQLRTVGRRSLILSQVSSSIWELEADEAEALSRVIGVDGKPSSWSPADCDALLLGLSLRLFEHGLLTVRWHRSPDPVAA